MFLDDGRAPGGILVYYADGGEEIVYANPYIVEMFGCDSIEDFLEHTSGTFRHFVFEEDLEAVEDRHDQVQQDDREVIGVLVHDVEGLLAVLGVYHVVVVLEDYAQGIPVDLVVIDDQYQPRPLDVV
jgi:PAS domain-containing protein